MSRFNSLDHTAWVNASSGWSSAAYTGNSTTRIAGFWFYVDNAGVPDHWDTFGWANLELVTEATERSCILQTVRGVYGKNHAFMFPRDMDMSRFRWSLQLNPWIASVRLATNTLIRI